MRTPDFVLATLDEAAPALARLRAALTGTRRLGAVVVLAAGLLAIVRQHPGSVLYEIAAFASLSVDEVEAQLRALARLGLVQAAAGEDGIVRWWPVEAPP